MVQITDNNDELINLTEAAKVLGVSREWLYTLIERGELHPIQIADRQFLKQSEIEEFKNNRNSGNNNTNKA